MTIQEAAYKLLNEAGKPLSSKELAKIAIERRMVSSAAQDPIQSHAQTIEKNIRGDVYNKPKLIFIYEPQGRLIGLPGWDDNSAQVKKPMPTLVDLKARIPAELFSKIKLAEQAKLESDFDKTVSWLLTKGLSLASSEIKKGLMVQLDSL